MSSRQIDCGIGLGRRLQWCINHNGAILSATASPWAITNYAMPEQSRIPRSKAASTDVPGRQSHVETGTF